MRHDITARVPMPSHDTVHQRDQRSDLFFRERPVTPFMSRIDYFDADAGAVHVGYAPPIGQHGMPGALVLVDHLDDLPILGHAIMGRHLRSRVPHPLYGGCSIPDRTSVA